MAQDFKPQIDAWMKLCTDPATDPVMGMAEAGMLAPADSYAAIARGKTALVERTGLPGVASVWGGRQMIARWFTAGFGTEEQRAVWLHRPAAVAISEPRVGAHPKLLTTRAVTEDDAFRITGEKAWVSNGPTADLFIVLAITKEQQGRKRYSAFLVPRDAPGLAVTEMPGFHALRPSRHCGLVLQDVAVPRAAMLGPEGTAYETMALPFRNVEDAVGTFTLLGAFRLLRARLVARNDEDAASLGAITGLIAVFAAAAEAVVTALDAGRLAEKAAALVGLHVFAAELLQRIRGLPGAGADEMAEQLLADLDALFSVAKGPRLARQRQLGR